MLRKPERDTYFRVFVVLGKNLLMLGKFFKYL